MNRILFCFVFFLATASLGIASPPKRMVFAAKFLEANQMLEERLWIQSINAWQELLVENPNNANVNYKIGYCYLQTANSKLEALQYLEAACDRKFSKSYDQYDPIEKRAPVQALFYLGRAQALNLKIDDAIATFQKLQKVLGKKHLMYIDATRELEMCQEAKSQMANPKNYTITNVGPTLNTASNEYSPVLSLDESTMFFTSPRMRPDSSNSKIIDFMTMQFKDDIYATFKNEEGVWMEPEMLNLNTDAHDAAISVSPDGQTLFIYRDNFGDGQLLESTLIGETWSEPLMLGSDINTAAWETHATVSADGNTLLFVSDRIGGVGKRDIYRCVKLPNGEWSRALNIGTQVNTIYDEDAPFLTADGKTLYFASRGHNTMGGFDIFSSKLGQDGEWSAPVTLGYPINTVDDDIFFVPMADGRRAYYSSSKDGGYGLKDIYLVDMPDITEETQLAVLKGYVITPEGEELPDDLRILVKNDKNAEVSEYRPRKRDGGYLAVLNPCTSYHIEYYKGKEKIKDDDINVPCETSFQEIEREVFLVPINLTKEVPAPEKPAETPGKKTDVKGGADKKATGSKTGNVTNTTTGANTKAGETPTAGGKVATTATNAAKAGAAALTAGEVFSGKIEEPAITATPAGQSLEPIDLKFNKTDPIGRQFIPEKGFAQYAHYFVYGSHNVIKDEADFAYFVRDIDAIIKAGKKPVVVIEASASKVPSVKYSSNEELVQLRFDAAHDLVRDAMKAYGREEGKDYTFGKGIKSVQGKDYENDSKKNRLLYEQYQYVKVRVQG
jgi:Tol biopolymer transport system component